MLEKEKINVDTACILVIGTVGHLFKNLMARPTKFLIHFLSFF